VAKKKKKRKNPLKAGESAILGKAMREAWREIKRKRK
jgi:hypothetical protein